MNTRRIDSTPHPHECSPPADATIAEKNIFLSQAIDFRAFSGGGNVTIVRPSTLITQGAQGSYGLYFP